MDRVKLEPLERADLEDVKALTDLAYEYDQRALGALLGAADLSAYDGGLLSGPLHGRFILRTVTYLLKFVCWWTSFLNNWISV